MESRKNLVARSVSCLTLAAGGYAGRLEEGNIMITVMVVYTWVISGLDSLLTRLLIRLASNSFILVGYRVSSKRPRVITVLLPLFFDVSSNIHNLCVPVLDRLHMRADRHRLSRLDIYHPLSSPTSIYRLIYKEIDCIRLSRGLGGTILASDWKNSSKDLTLAWKSISITANFIKIYSRRLTNISKMERYVDMYVY